MINSIPNFHYLHWC